MSMHLHLAEYPCNSDGKLYEPPKNNIRSVSINRDIYNDLINSGLTENFTLYEDSSLEESNEFKKIKESKIHEALALIERKLIHLLESDQLAKFKEIQSREDTSVLMSAFYEIAGAYKIIESKIDGFSDFSNIIVTVE